ncbi:hypothetical protein [Catenulispora subtropica]|uniref:WXG100 family type VII secretion target n=1 Tax=Catenulispora subtropica TaxID=450798 RepID=A0ABP5ERM1_9ACTN
MPAPGYDFEVRPPLLTAYADTLERAATDLAAVADALARVRVERHWFGELPQSGFLAERYAGHCESELAVAGELGAWLREAAEGLRQTAARYSAADRVVADLAGTVEAGLGVGIETRGEALQEIGEPGGAGG